MAEKVLVTVEGRAFERDLKRPTGDDVQQIDEMHGSALGHARRSFTRTKKQLNTLLLQSP